LKENEHDGWNTSSADTDDDTGIVARATSVNAVGDAGRHAVRREYAAAVFGDTRFDDLTL
jgi:hypothetical protein